MRLKSSHKRYYYLPFGNFLTLATITQKFYNIANSCLFADCAIISMSLIVPLPKILTTALSNLVLFIYFFHN